MAFIFAMPQLPPIMESAAPPPIPKKSPNRPVHSFGSASLQSDYLPPPTYTAVIYAQLTKSDGEASYIRNDGCMRLVGRGASRKAWSIAAVALALIIGLVVGLVVGLGKRHQANVKYVSVHLITLYPVRRIGG